MKVLEEQHQKDKEGALTKQKEAYEQELAALKSQLNPLSSPEPSGPGQGRVEGDVTPSQAGDGSIAVQPCEEWNEDRWEAWGACSPN